MLYTRRMPVAPLLDDDMFARRIRVHARDVVYVRGIFEASEGIGTLFAESGGDLTLACPRSQVQEFERLIDDLSRELDGDFSLQADNSACRPVR